MEKTDKSRSAPRPKSSGVIKLYSTEFSKDESLNKRFKESKNCRIVANPNKNKPVVLSESIKRLGSSTSSSGNSQNIKDWINVKCLVNLRDKQSPESDFIKQLYGTVLMNEENFVQGIEEFLKEQELLRLRKKEILYRKWQERVYIPLRKEVEKVMNERFDQIDSQRRKEHSKYIEHGNVKSKIFLDVHSPDEYDPFVLYNSSSRFALHARTPRLDDPLLKFERQRMDEEKDIARCDSGEEPTEREIAARRLPPHPLVPLGRSGSKHSTWMSLSLQNMEGPDRNRGRQRKIGRLNKSNIDFNSWNETVVGPELVDREMRLQKKRHFDLPSTMPSQAILLEQFEPLRDSPVVRFNAPPVSSTT